MPRCIATDWRLLGYCCLLLLTFLISERVRHKRLKRYAWHVGFCALGICTAYALLDFVPYYFLETILPRWASIAKSVVAVVLLVPMVVALVRDPGKMDWDE